MVKDWPKNETSTKSLAMTCLSQPPLSHIMMASYHVNRCDAAVNWIACGHKGTRMDFFLSVLEIFRKRQVEATIRTQFELCHRMGIQVGRPAILARHVVALVFNDMPKLSEGRLKGLVLATAVLVRAFMRSDLPREMRVLCAAALSRMLLAAHKEGSLYTYPPAEEALLQTAQELIRRFNTQQQGLSRLMRG